jgi:DNA replication protein DnaC
MEKLGESLGDIMEAIKKLQEAQERHERDYPEAVAEWRAREAETRAADALRPYRACGVPVEIAKELAGGNLAPLPLEQKMLQALKQGIRIVVLCGTLGTGKTIAACRWVVAQWDGLYVKSYEYVALSDHMDKDRPRIEEIKSVESLVLDELAMEQDRDAHKIEALVHHRYDHGLVTVLAINRSPAETEKHLGDRIMSRIYQSGAIISTEKIVRRGEIVRRQSRSKKC